MGLLVQKAGAASRTYAGGGGGIVLGEAGALGWAVSCAATLHRRRSAGGSGGSASRGIPCFIYFQVNGGITVKKHDLLEKCLCLPKLHYSLCLKKLKKIFFP